MGPHDVINEQAVQALDLLETVPLFIADAKSYISDFGTFSGIALTATEGYANYNNPSVTGIATKIVNNIFTSISNSQEQCLGFPSIPQSSYFCTAGTHIPVKINDEPYQPEYAVGGGQELEIVIKGITPKSTLGNVISLDIAGRDGYFPQPIEQSLSQGLPIYISGIGGSFNIPLTYYRSFPNQITAPVAQYVVCPVNNLIYLQWCSSYYTPTIPSQDPISTFIITNTANITINSESFNSSS